MSVALYFGKVNLISYQINGIIDNKYSYRELLVNVLNALKDDISFTYERPIKVDDEMVSEEVNYSLSIKEKQDTYLQGYIYKTSYIHYKDYNKKEKTLVPQKVQNTEGAEFYYDIFREMVGYQRTLRLGYKEFLYAFQGILNKACRQSNFDYSFSVDQYTEGLSIDDLKRDLLNNKNIQKLKIKYQIPNPEQDILKAIQADPEQMIKNFQLANLATKNVTYLSSSPDGLNIESKIIGDELENISSIHSMIGAKKATQNGYIEVEATDNNGLTQSTADTRPVIKHIDDISELKDKASSTIISRIRNEIKE